jgi:hypothetical protein
MLAALACICFAAGRWFVPSSAGPVPEIIRTEDNSPIRNSEVRPLLSDSFGKMIEIEGVVEKAPVKGYSGPMMLKVLRISGQTLKAPLRIHLKSPTDTSIAWPEQGSQLRLRGYEGGTFDGVPRKLLITMAEAPQVADFGFDPAFYVTKVLSTDTPK